MLQAYSEIRWVRRRRWCLPALVPTVGVHVAILAAALQPSRWPITRMTAEEEPTLLIGPEPAPSIQADYVCSPHYCRRPGCVVDCPVPCRRLSAPGTTIEQIERVEKHHVDVDDIWNPEELDIPLRALGEVRLCVYPDGEIWSLSMLRSTGSRKADHFAVAHIRAWRHDNWPPMTERDERPFACTTLTIFHELTPLEASIAAQAAVR